MTNESVTQEDLAALRRYDTPSICNALEVVAHERRGQGLTSETFICADPSLTPLVGALSGLCQVNRIHYENSANL